MGERRGDPARVAAFVSPERNVVPELGVLVLDEQVARMLLPLRASSGVVVAAGRADSPQGDDPLLPGDVIYSLNREPVASVEALRGSLARLRHGDTIVLQVERGGELRYVTLLRE